MEILLKEGYEIQAPNNYYPKRKFKLIKNIDNNIYRSEVSGWNELQEVTLQFIESNRVDQRFIENLNFIKQSQEKSETKEIFSENIVKILEFDWINQKQYFLIVMEKIETDLFQYIKERRVQLEQHDKLQLCLDITQSIALIHNHDFLNRDIKPESFFKVQNKFKLGNFLLMRKQIKQDSIRMTQNIGTKMFSAPEMIQNKPKYTQKVDIWSLACVFYEIFDGKPLFDQNPDKEINNHIQNQKPVQDKIDNLFAPKEFKQLMKDMLNPGEEKRLNCQQVKQGLKQIIKSLEKINSSQIKNNQQFLLNKSYNIRPNTQESIPQTPEKYHQKQISEIIKNHQQQKLQIPYNENQRIETLEQQVIELKESIQYLTQIIKENEQNYSQKISKLEQEVKDLQSKCNQQRNFTEIQYALDPVFNTQEMVSNLNTQISKRNTNQLDDRQFNYLKEDFQKKNSNQVKEMLFYSNNVENPLQNQKQQQSNQNQYNQNEINQQPFLNYLKQSKNQNQFQCINRDQNDQKQEKQVIVEYINNDRKKVKL